MFGDASRLNPLQSRKQLLIAESELNRAQLIYELKSMSGEVRLLTKQFGKASSLVSAAVTLLVGLVSCRRNRLEPARETFSWWPALLNGAGLVGSFWSKFGTKHGGRNGELNGSGGRVTPHGNRTHL